MRRLAGLFDCYWNGECQFEPTSAFSHCVFCYGGFLPSYVSSISPVATCSIYLLKRRLGRARGLRVIFTFLAGECANIPGSAPEHEAHILCMRIVEIKQLKVNVLVVSLIDALGIIRLRACMFFMVTALSFIHLIVRLNPSTGHSTTNTLTDQSALSYSVNLHFMMEWVMSFTSRFLLSRVFVFLRPRTDALTFHSSPLNELMNHD